MEFSSRLFSYEAPVYNEEAKIPAGILHQASELSVIRSGEITEHIQFCDEITYVVSGKATFFSADTSCELHEGQVHFIKKGIYHKIIADENTNCRYICIGFSPNEEYRDIAAFFKATETIDYFIADDTANIRVLSELFLNEFYQWDNQSTTMINMYFCQILISLSRLILESSDLRINREKESNSISNFALYNALRYIDREYLCITSVKSVSEALSYNEYYLSHLFKEKVGISMKTYILKKKTKAAAELLKTGNLSIKELSEYLGFATQHTFSQAFKRFYGMSPSDFRNSV